MDLEQLSQLKQRLVEGDDHGEVMQDFLEALDADPSFMDLGEPVENELLMHIIGEAGREMFGDPPQFDCVILIQVPAANFIHGSFLLCGRVANVMYFPDIGIGVFAVVVSLGSNPCTRIVRFTAHLGGEGLPGREGSTFVVAVRGQRQDAHAPGHRVDQPVLPDPGPLVDTLLLFLVDSLGAGRKHLDHEIRHHRGEPPNRTCQRVPPLDGDERDVRLDSVAAGQVESLARIKGVTQGLPPEVQLDSMQDLTPDHPMWPARGRFHDDEAVQQLVVVQVIGWQGLQPTGKLFLGHGFQGSECQVLHGL
jgi:hypothetical protein